MPAEPLLTPLADETLARFAMRGQVGLRVAGRAIRVSSNAEVLLAALREYFRDFVADISTADIEVAAIESPPADFGLTYTPYPPGPGKSKIKDEYVNFADGRVVRKRLTGMAFVFGDLRSIAIGPCVANSNQVVNFVNNRLIQWHLDRGYLLCHAAGVARMGRGLLLAGLSGRGKSTLALHALSRGLDFVSNDRLLIKRTSADVEMVGVAKLPRVNPGTVINNDDLVAMFSPEERRQYAALTPEQLWELEHKYDVDVTRHFGADRFQPRASMVGGVILAWRRGACDAPELRRVDLRTRPELLGALIKSPGIHYYAPSGGNSPDLSEDNYLRHLRALPVWEVAGGVDFASVADRIGAELGA